MKYVYTSYGCPKCVELKKSLAVQGIPFTERDADRLKHPDKPDDIDRDALVKLIEQGYELPVEIDDMGKEAGVK